MDIMVYTFRTFPYIEDLKKTFPKVYVFGKIKEDLEDFFEEIKNSNPDFILGIAKSDSNNSYFEPKTINQFNKKARIIKNGSEECPLFIPDLTGSKFKISNNTADSFCNYTMYKIKYFLEQQKMQIPFSFVHINQKHINELSLATGM